MENQEQEIDLEELLSRSKLELLAPDFENTVIMRIKKLEHQKASVLRNLKISWICMVIGTVLGTTLLLLLPNLQISFFGESTKAVEIVYQILFTLFVLMNLEILLKYSKKFSTNYLSNVQIDDI